MEMGSLKSWRTTAFGIVSAFFTFVLFSPELGWPFWMTALAKFALVGGLAGLGITARDYRAAKVIFVLLLAGAAAKAGTRIQDMLYRADGSPAGGKIYITGQKMQSSGKTVVVSTVIAVVSNGVVDITLEPNDAASPSGTSYKARYYLSDGTAYEETWVVPTSQTPVKVADIRTATTPLPGYTISLPQLAQGGASTGQCLTWTGTSWQPGTCAEGAGGAVTSVAGRIGAVELGIPDIGGLQSTLDGKQAALGFTPEDAANRGLANGYASLDAGGKVPTGQIPAAGGDLSGTLGAATVTRIQNQPVAAVAPADGQMMRWSAAAGRWEPVKVRHTVTFSEATVVTVLGTEHQLGTADLTITCYDAATPPNVVEAGGWTIDPSTYDVTITFAVAFSGRCVLR
jgi:hypothetical protein